MSLLHEISPNAEVVSQQNALQVNVAAAVGLQSVLSSNLGPQGTLKLLVGGAGQLKLTKDGLTLLKEMQIQHPTAALIARTATAQDDIVGDGTTSTVLLVGELLKQCLPLALQVHPRLLTDGLDIARDAALELLKTLVVEQPDMIGKRDLLQQVAATSLATKVDGQLVNEMSYAVVDAIQTIHVPESPIDLHRIETLTLQRRNAHVELIRGLVLDHGGRHPGMPDELKNAYVLILNVSLEYENAETQSGFAYSTAAEREKLVESERKWLDERVRKIVALKRQVCTDENQATFCVINQKGADPLTLDIMAKENILCLRRAKRRNMERLALATGGQQVLSLEDLAPEVLGRAGHVQQVSYGEDKYTFLRDCPQATSCTLMVHGPNQLTIHQMQDAIKDGLRAVKNAVEDGALVPGGGAFEIACHEHLMQVTAPATPGKVKLGVKAFAEALLVIPKTLAQNAGWDVIETVLALQDERNSSGLAVGLDTKTGQPMVSADEGVWDNVRVKRQSLHLATVLANQLLLVDEVMRAGKQMGKRPSPEEM